MKKTYGYVSADGRRYETDGFMADEAKKKMAVGGECASFTCVKCGEGISVHDDVTSIEADEPLAWVFAHARCCQ